MKINMKKDVENSFIIVCSSGMFSPCLFRCIPANIRYRVIFENNELITGVLVFVTKKFLDLWCILCEVQPNNVAILDKFVV